VRLCERTLRSICGQTSTDFRVVLVANEFPKTCFEHPALRLVLHPFPLPGNDRDDRMRDKGLKLKHGLLACRDLTEFHVMFVDADDCVSNRIAKYVNARPAHHGWFLRTGWLHEQGSRSVLLRKEFQHVCGTSHIIRCTRADLPENEHVPDEANWITSHGIAGWVDFHRARGTPLAPLPFPGAIYCTGTGENDSGISMRKWQSRRLAIYRLFHTRLLTRGFRQEFGLWPLPPPTKSRGGS
jgi:hypothetical protein